MGFIKRAPLTGLDLIRLNSVRWTQWLQQMSGLHSSTQTEVLRTFSYMTDSWFMYFWLYPICTLIHPLLGFQVLFALLTSEWISIILKCFFPDDRPYWWFPTTEYSAKGAHETTIYEFPETCETTSGFPSSHSMLFAACSIVILLHIRDRIKKANLEKKIWSTLNSLLLPTFLVLNFAGMVGRIFVTTNFHYQSLAGFVLGCCIGKFAYCTSTSLFSFDTKKAKIMLYLVFGSLLLFIFGFLITPWDPFWCIDAALKWCWNTHNVFKETKKTIFYYAVRVTGIAVGFVYSNNVGGIWLRMGSMATLPEKVLLGFFYVLEIQLWTMVEAFGSASQILVYAAITFVMSILHVISITTFLPTLVTKFMSLLERTRDVESEDNVANILGSFSNQHLAMKPNLRGSYDIVSEDENAVIDTRPLLSSYEINED